jgi:hypothetical protein
MCLVELYIMNVQASNVIVTNSGHKNCLDTVTETNFALKVGNAMLEKHEAPDYRTR